MEPLGGGSTFGQIEQMGKIDEDAVLHDSGSVAKTKDPNVVKRVGEEGKKLRRTEK